MSGCMTLGQAADWLGQVLSDPAHGDLQVMRVHTDTRSLQAGDLFVALKGERFDANALLAQVFKHLEVGFDNLVKLQAYDIQVQP